MNQIKYFNVDNLKIGIMSDSQITPLFWKDKTTFESNLVSALQTFKANHCNMIIFAGDICNKASKYAYKRFLQCFHSVYGKDLPIIQYIMGNHDYYSFLGEKHCRKLFEDMLEVPPLTHYVVNGYHFLGVSPNNSSMFSAYGDLHKWLEDNIKIALEDNKDKPIFITTHNSPKNSVYGSEDWGDTSLEDIFSKYDNIINFAGHSHYSILDERSLYVGKYTALSTQSISYIELEMGKENGTIPPMAYNYPMGYILDFDNGNVFAHRVDLKRNVFLKEDKLWQLYPFKDNKPKEVKPLSFENKQIRYKLINDMTKIIFDTPVSDDIVHSYKVIVNDAIEQLYFSDFYMGIDSDKKEQKILLYNLPRGFYNIKIYAIDSYGNLSKDYLEIDRVPIIKKTKYRKIQTPEKLNYRI